MANLRERLARRAVCQWDRTCRRGRPSFEQGLVSERTNHLGDICTSGVGCSLGGNRRLLDFFDLGIDREGRIGVSWADTVNGLNGPTLMFSTVADGASLYGRLRFRGAAATGAAKDRGADARAFPAGTQLPAADFVSSALSPSRTALKVTVRIASPDIATTLRDANARHMKYVTRWSYGDAVYFVVAVSDGTTMTFYGGKLDANDGLPSRGTRAYGIVYARDFDVQGRIAGGTIEIAVPCSAVGDPKRGARLPSVQSFAIAGLDDAVTAHPTAPQTLDATPPYDALVQT
ncbi:MAG: hypothetical protein ACRDJM_04955 [Actinomycetota bacterium]